MDLSDFYTTAPAASSCQQVTESFALLDRLGIAYERIEHDPADTPEVCDAVRKALGLRICKNLFLCNRQKTAFYLVTMPEDKPFQAKDVSRQIGSARLSFAPPELMEKIIHCSPGSASVLGLAYDTEHRVTQVLDREVYEAERFACHPCQNAHSLRFATRDLLEVFLPYTGHVPIVAAL